MTPVTRKNSHNYTILQAECLGLDSELCLQCMKMIQVILPLVIQLTHTTGPCMHTYFHYGSEALAGFTRPIYQHYALLKILLQDTVPQ